MKVFDTLTDVAGIYPLFSVLQKWKSKKMTTSEKSKKPVKYTIRGKVDRKKEKTVQPDHNWVLISLFRIYLKDNVILLKVN